MKCTEMMFSVLSLVFHCLPLYPPSPVSLLPLSPPSSPPSSLPQIYTTKAGKDVIEAQSMHKCIPLLFSICLITLFITRAIYDIVVTVVDHSVQYGLNFPTDMVSGVVVLCSIASYPGL